MKMTNDAITRFEAMVGDFAKCNNLLWECRHDSKGCLTTVVFQDGSGCYNNKHYQVVWAEAKSLTDICVTVFVDLTVAWKLNTRTPKADMPSVGQMLHETVEKYMDDKFNIKDVIFNDPATIVLWEDGTKTVVKCQDGDNYSKESGLALCIAKKAFGNQGNFNNVFKKWIPEEENDIKVATKVNVADVLPELAKPRDELQARLAKEIEKAFKRIRMGCV